MKAQTWNISGSALKLVNVGRQNGLNTKQHIVDIRFYADGVQRTFCGKRQDASAFSTTIDFDTYEQVQRSNICVNCARKAIRMEYITQDESAAQGVTEAAVQVNAQIVGPFTSLVNNPDASVTWGYAPLADEIRDVDSLTGEELEGMEDEEEQRQIDELLVRGMTLDQARDWIELETGVRPGTPMQVEAVHLLTPEERESELRAAVEQIEAGMARFLRAGGIKDEDAIKPVIDLYAPELINDLSDAVAEDQGW